MIGVPSIADAKAIVVQLDPNLVIFARRPRTKKRRIQWKWCLNPKNWKPDPRLWQRTFLFGAAAKITDERYEEIQNTLYLSIHPERWEEVRKVCLFENATVIPHDPAYGHSKIPTKRNRKRPWQTRSEARD